MSNQAGRTPNDESNKVDVGGKLNWQLILLLLLFIAVVFTSIKTVAQRHEARSQFVKLQALGKERDKLAAQWSRLKLEQSTMLNQVRVERLASRDLNMQMPKPSEKKMIRERYVESPSVFPVVSAPKNSTVALGD